jgi:hypothetical protein
LMLGARPNIFWAVTWCFISPVAMGVSLTW